jgi:hypothetical protein
MVTIACRKRVKMSRMHGWYQTEEAQEFRALAEFAYHRLPSALFSSHRLHRPVLPSPTAHKVSVRLHEICDALRFVGDAVLVDRCMGEALWHVSERRLAKSGLVPAAFVCRTFTVNSASRRIYLSRRHKELAKSYRPKRERDSAKHQAIERSQ